MVEYIAQTDIKTRTGCGLWEWKKMRKEKSKRKKSGFRRLILFLLVLLAVLLGGWYYLVGRLYGEINYQEAAGFKDKPWKGGGAVNILLIGNDSRGNDENGRSDAMILLSVNKKAKTVYMTSILRDIYVEIPGHDGNRLNAAYSFGGPELLMETIGQNFDIEVNRYVMVNFEAFAGLVDAVGGVDLEVTGQEIEYINAYLVEYNMLTERPEGTDYMDTAASGLVHLNGPQALAYSRNRYMGTDFGRTQRQRKVLAGIVKNLPPALLSGPGEVLEGILPNLTTNLTKRECMELSLLSGKFLSYEWEQGSIPLEGSYQNATIREMEVLQIDFDKNKEYLHERAY